MIRVRIRKASDDDYDEIKVFKSYKEMINYLRKHYTRWVLTFDYTEKYDISVLMYDDYIE